MFYAQFNFKWTIASAASCQNGGYAQFWASLRNDLGNDTLNE